MEKYGEIKKLSLKLNKELFSNIVNEYNSERDIKVSKEEIASAKDVITQLLINVTSGVNTRLVPGDSATDVIIYRYFNKEHMLKEIITATGSVDTYIIPPNSADYKSHSEIVSAMIYIQNTTGIENKTTTATAMRLIAKTYDKIIAKLEAGEPTVKESITKAMRENIIVPMTLGYLLVKHNLYFNLQYRKGENDEIVLVKMIVQNLDEIFKNIK